MHPQSSMATSEPDWRPGASPALLRARAALLTRIRAFFAERDVLEVETPALMSATVSDPRLESLTIRCNDAGDGGGRRLYLQTSPESAMKRLLAAGSGPIYQLARVFRAGEAGRFHNPEFTMLEWYRPGFDHHRLMEEVEALVAGMLDRSGGFERVTYAELFRRSLGLDPHAASGRDLEDCARHHGLESALPLDRNGLLDLLLSLRIAPRLGFERPVFIVDFPADQAALARIRPGRPPVAERFELYIDGIELANGYHELDDGVEQRRRCERDRRARRRSGLPDIAADERLLAALGHGLPACAGVALGFDRLVMLATGAGTLDEVIAFSVERA